MLNPGWNPRQSSSRPAVSSRVDAEAVLQNIELILELRRDVALAPGAGHVRKKDARRLPADSPMSGAATRAPCAEFQIEEASGVGLVEVSDALRVAGWQEKPHAPKPMPGSPETALSSRGICACDRAALRQPARPATHQAEATAA